MPVEWAQGLGLGVLLGAAASRHCLPAAAPTPPSAAAITTGPPLEPPVAESPGSAALVTGAFLDAYPKETAKLCKRLKAGVSDKDEVVAGHCVRAMESLDVLLGERLALPDDAGKSDLHRIVGGIGKSTHDLKL